MICSMVKFNSPEYRRRQAERRAAGKLIDPQRF
jgi:hypothetical protein